LDTNLSRRELYKILIEAFRFCQSTKELRIYSYVILDNHFHLIVSAPDLSNVMRSFKRYTASKIISKLRQDNEIKTLDKHHKNKKSYKTLSNYQVWQEGFHPQLISNINIMRQKIDYIHNNPVRRKLVEDPCDWKYSSAVDYYEKGKGLIEIVRLT
jgi:putative transposase